MGSRPIVFKTRWRTLSDPPVAPLGGARHQRLLQPRWWTRADNALNVYVAGHTQRMADIKCVQDIDAAGRRQYGVDLPDIRNEQVTVRGDLTPQHRKAATVPGDPSTRTIPCMGVMWRDDVT
jgi:hypothetical protein